LRFLTRLLLGSSGTGRTTFVNTLCESEVLTHKVADNPEVAHVEEGIRIKPVNVGTLRPSFPFLSSAATDVVW
jgi:septin family protein